MAALSAGASDTSGWLLIGLPGFAYAAGLEAVWIAVGLVVGLSSCWLSMARRLRIYTELCDDALTLPVYLHRRFHCQMPWLRGIAAVFILMFFLFYVSSGLIAGAKLFNTVFDLPYQWAVWLGTLAIISYTLFGGFLAVSWTDVLQGLLITFALLLVPLILLGQDTNLSNSATSNSEFYSLWTDAQGNSLGFIAIASSLAWGLGYFGQPHILSRFKAIQSHKQVKSASIIAITWSLFAYSGAVSVGVLSIAYLSEPLQDSEQVFMVAVEALFNPWVAGILLATILAAIMSTADSQLLVSASAMTEDICHGFAKNLSPQKIVVLGRTTVALLAIFAAIFAMNPDSKVLDVVSYAWAGLGASLGPCLLISLYWRKMSDKGALAGVLVGGITVVVWSEMSGGVFDLYELLPGFLLSALSIFIVSLLWPQKNEVMDKEFDRMLEKLNQG